MNAAYRVVWLGCLTLATSARADLAVVEVSPGIYRGPAPETAADYRQLRALGIRTVLDVRKFRRRRLEEHCRCVRAHGMAYRSVPVAFRPHRDGSAEQALCTLADARLHPIYIHCFYGRDRSGLVVGLYRVRCEGWSLQAAFAEMKRFGFSDRLPGLERYFWECARRSSGSSPYSLASGLAPGTE